MTSTREDQNAASQTPFVGAASSRGFQQGSSVNERTERLGGLTDRKVDKSGTVEEIMGILFPIPDPSGRYHRGRVHDEVSQHTEDQKNQRALRPPQPEEDWEELDKSWYGSLTEEQLKMLDDEFGFHAKEGEEMRGFEDDDESQEFEGMPGAKRTGS